MKSYRHLAAIQTDLKAGTLTCESLVNQYLTVIEQGQSLNIFLEVFGEEALERARSIDQKIKENKAGKLAGMVLGIKDNICIQGHKVSAASKILEGFTSLYHATVIERLLAEDAIIIGRCNCDEFAMGSSNENSAFGSVSNPLNADLVPGGSSGGSAAAVAAGMCLAALGTDTGGSIRQPASFCGVVGLKPTYGRVSRYGAIAYASSFDQIGPITQSVSDAAILMEVMAGPDEFDSTVSHQPVPNYSQVLEQGKDRKLKIAYLNDCYNAQGLDAEIQAHLTHTFEQLKAQGHEVVGVDFPFLEYMIPAYYVLTTAEASSNLARYDGINFGYRSPNAVDFESTVKLSRAEGFGKEVQRRILLGTFVLSAGYYDAYYSKAQKVRRLLRDKTNEILSQYDFILMPTTPGTAFAKGNKTSDPIVMYLEDIFTVQANLTGLPAISIPTGKHSNGLPFGLQIIGSAFSEDKLMAFAHQWMEQ